MTETFHSHMKISDKHQHKTKLLVSLVHVVLELVVVSDNSEAVLDIIELVLYILSICNLVGVIVDSMGIVVDIVNSVGNCIQALEGNRMLSVDLGNDTTVGCLKDGEVLWLEAVN